MRWQWPNRDSVYFVLLFLVLSTVSFVPAPSAQAVSCTIGSSNVNQSLGVSGTQVDSGTSNNPFPIQDVNDLIELNACIDAAQTTGVFYQLTNDIDLSNSGLTEPLGSDNKPFRGSLDGASGSHSLRISGISFSSTAQTAGFFHELSGATVSNLILSGRVLGNASSNASLGGLSGEVASSQITNLTTQLDVVAQSTAASMNVGGIVGQYARSTFSSISIAVGSSAGLISASARSVWVGGIGGRTWSRGQSVFQDIRVDVPIRASALNFSAYVGGVVGNADLSGLTPPAITESVTISRADVSSTIEVLRANNDAQVGGLVGAVAEQTLIVNRSAFSGFILIPSNDLANNTSVGGLLGGSSDPEGAYISISSSVVNGAFRTLGEASFIGGVSGRLQDADARIEVNQVLLNGILGNFSPSGAYALGNVASGGFISASGLLRNSNSWNSTNNAYSAALTQVELSDPLNIPFLDYAASQSDPNATWNQCGVPFLSWQVSRGCDPSVVGSYIDSSGTNLVVYFSQAMDSSGPSPTGLSVRDGSGQTIQTSNPVWSNNARELQVSLSAPILKGSNASLTIDSSNLKAFSSSKPITPKQNAYVVNLSSLSGPTATLGSASLSPSSVDIGVVCGGSCGPVNNYSFTATITPSGGQPWTISGTASTSTTTLSFTALSANVAHTIRASVTYNGQTSATVSTTVTTLRPIATISSVVVTETTATLGVGCTNCGSSPDSFTISATPQAGGAAITSNTSVIAGLSSETTYSFAIVISFAGTTSASVNWQGNPVRTNPYSPVIANVSPSSGPLSGGLITVTGSNFSTSDQLTFAGVTVSFTVVNGTTITFTAPAGIAGAVDLAIRNPAGIGTKLNAFTYVPAPSLSSISPSLATINGGTVVTLRGANLSGATGINLGSVNLSVTVISVAELRFVTPATSAGIVDVGVVTPGGTATLSQALEFTTSALIPIVTSITPSSGPASGGTTITVTGRYFSGSYADAISVAINGVSGSSVIVVNDSTLTFLSPPGAAAAGLDVAVFTGGGLGILAGAFSYTAPPQSNGGGSSVGAGSPATPPEISSFSLRILGIQGGTVTISGRRLTGISSLTVGGLAASVMGNSDTEATFTISNLPAGIWDLVLINGYGKLTFLQAITVAAPPVAVQTSSGELLGWTWTPKFERNSRTLSAGQQLALDKLAPVIESSTTIVCWGYTTSKTPNSWAINHATSRAQAACDYLSEKLGVKAVVRIRFGAEKSHAMRAAIQFWK